jgi:hypothetical protein
MTSNVLTTLPVSSIKKYFDSKPLTRLLYIMVECRPSLEYHPSLLAGSSPTLVVIALGVVALYVVC